jgi:glutathione S-transferase
MSSTKKARTHPNYELLYHPGKMPGRGEFIRLAFEAAGVSYKDVSNEQENGTVSHALAAKSIGLLTCSIGREIIANLVSSKSTGDSDSNPPVFAPPALRIPGEGKNGKALLISQTPSILNYLGDKLDLAGDDEAEKAWILSHTLTALDLNNEAHDTHHPIRIMDYYENQKEEALQKAKSFREDRIPKFLGFFERVLKGNAKEGQGKYLVGGRLSYADTSVWHVLSGLLFAFPKELEARKKEYPTLFDTFYPSVQEHSGLKEYLASERRFPFNQGIYRHYPELDRQ